MGIPNGVNVDTPCPQRAAIGGRTVTSNSNMLKIMKVCLECIGN